MRKLRPIISKAGKEHGIPLEEAEYIVYNFFKSISKSLKDPRIPKVKIPLLGTFYPRKINIYRSLKASIRYYKAGGITREYLNSRINRLWKVRSRILQEELGENTWDTWKKKEKVEEFNNLLKNEEEEKIKSREEIFRSNNNSKDPKKIIRDL